MSLLTTNLFRTTVNALLLSAAVTFGLPFGGGARGAIRPHSLPPAAKPAGAVASFAELPLSFEPNRGQADARTSFLSRGPGYTLLLRADEAVLALRAAASNGDAEGARGAEEVRGRTLRMRLVGADASAPAEGQERLAGVSNYLIGRDRSRWRKGIPRYGRVRYPRVYPGIDVVYYGTNQRQLEYDFVVAPGADPRAIRLAFEGADDLRLDSDGGLRLKLGREEVVQPAPFVYQEDGAGGRRQVAGRYVLAGPRGVVFEVGDYDRGRALVIDPQLVYATFYGGSGNDLGEDVAADAAGHAYLTGFTTSPNLLLGGAVNDGSYSGTSDAFVVKLNPAGTDVVYATYLGGSSSDGGAGIAVTTDGRACVTGFTDNSDNSGDFPTTPDAYQGNGFFLGSRVVDAYVAVLTPGGDNLSYSTLFGGDDADTTAAIALDAANKIYIVGETISRRLPTKNAFQNSANGRDAFIAKFDPAQSGNDSLVYSSYLGGTGSEHPEDIAVTPAGVAFVVGTTGSFNYPTKSPGALPPLQTAQGGVNDGFVAKVSPSGALVYSTYFGGNDRDTVFGVAVDSSERAYVTGFTISGAATFPLRNAFDSTRSGVSDAFVAKLNADGTALFYSSYLPGGASNDEGYAIAVDAGGNAYVAGITVQNFEFTAVNGFPAGVPGGPGSIFKIGPSDAAGTAAPKILYADTFPGAPAAVALDRRGSVFIAGSVSINIPTFADTVTPGSLQETHGGGPNDAFVLRVGSTFHDTVGVFRPSATDFLLRNFNSAGAPNITADFGQPGALPVVADWNGDGTDTVGTFNNGQWLIRNFNVANGYPTSPITFTFGLAGDLPLAGDWDGDGTDTVGVFRPSTGQFLLNNQNDGSSPEFVFTFGQPGDTPVVGDWDGDGTDTVGAFRGAGDWALRNANAAGGPDLAFNFGAAGDLPVTGDWDGDGVDTVGILRGGEFLLRNANAVGGVDITAAFGAAGDLPLAGDWDGKP